MNTPILFLIFNRPDLTQQVFNKIKAIKPKQLFIAADGPRNNQLEDRNKCELTRNLVLNNIDWDCKVVTLFRDKNLGCKKAVSSAINWFFDNVEEGIILEDDTVPNSSFFSYAETMLREYRNNDKVMHVAGANFQKEISNQRQSFYFSKYLFIWGWATWKHAWKKYDITMHEWPAYKTSEKFDKWCSNKQEKEYWTNIFDSVYSGKIDTWDYQWTFAVMLSNALCIVPVYNMITNIGFSANATHTRIYDSRLADLPAYEQNFSGKQENNNIINNKEADAYILNAIYLKDLNVNNSNSKTLFKRSIHKFKSLIKNTTSKKQD